MSGLSSDPAARASQLANLRRAPAGNQRAVSHGGYAVLARDRLDVKVREVYDALAEDAPLRDADGGLPAHDSTAVTLLAECLCRLEDVTANIRDFGVFQARGKHKGSVRPAVELESRLRREIATWLDSLGMTPKSRSALGLDLAKTRDLAREWAAQDGEDSDSAVGDAGGEHDG